MNLPLRLGLPAGFGIAVFLTLASLAGAQDEKRQLTAGDLVRDMRKAVAVVAMEARGKVSIYSKPGRPFWLGLQDSARMLHLIDEGLKKEEADPSADLEVLGRAVARLRASSEALLESSQRFNAGPGPAALSQVYRLLAAQAGPAAARKLQGGEPTEIEKVWLAKSREQVRKLNADLLALKEDDATDKAARQLLGTLVDRCAEVMEIQGNDLDAFARYADCVSLLDTELDGYGDVFELWYPNLPKDDWVLEGFVFETKDRLEEMAAIPDDDIYAETLARLPAITAQEIAATEKFLRNYKPAAATEPTIAVKDSDDDGDPDEEETAEPDVVAARPDAIDSDDDGDPDEPEEPGASDDDFADDDE